MLATPFGPLSDDEFRQLVASGRAIPLRQGASLSVAKWRDGPGVDADAFLLALRAQGSSLVIRRFKEDVNIRVLRHPPSAFPVGRAPVPPPSASG